MIVFGNNNAYLSTQPVQLFETADQGLTAFIMFKVRACAAATVPAAAASSQRQQPLLGPWAGD